MIFLSSNQQIVKNILSQFQSQKIYRKKTIQNLPTCAIERKKSQILSMIIFRSQCRFHPIVFFGESFTLQIWRSCNQQNLNILNKMPGAEENISIPGRMHTCQTWLY